MIKKYYFNSYIFIFTNHHFLYNTVNTDKRRQEYEGCENNRFPRGMFWLDEEQSSVGEERWGEKGVLYGTLRWSQRSLSGAGAGCDWQRAGIQPYGRSLARIKDGACRITKRKHSIAVPPAARPSDSPSVHEKIPFPARELPRRGQYSSFRTKARSRGK